MKARDCAEMAIVRYSGGNQMLLIEIVAIYTIALVEAIIMFPIKTHVKLPVRQKTHLNKAPKICIHPANLSTWWIFICLYIKFPQISLGKNKMRYMTPHIRTKDSETPTASEVTSAIGENAF
jgi:hypothetical protein